jgi:hypothetical protein
MDIITVATVAHETTGADKATCLESVKDGFRNLNHATAVFLSLTGGSYRTEALQTFLSCVAPSCSGKAAGNRVTMQRHPVKYAVKPEDTYQGVIRASGRSATVVVLVGASEADIAAFLETTVEPKGKGK